TTLFRSLMLCAALGALRYTATIPSLGPGSVDALIGRGELTLVGAVAADPRRSEDGQRVVVQIEVAREGGVETPVEGLALVVLPPYPAYNYGERLLVVGELKRPRAAERPGDFDYRAYLAHRGIFAIMQEPKQARRLPGAVGLAPLAALLGFRQHCRSVLLHTLPEPQAALAVGILVGLQSSIPAEVYGAFSATGTSHILVVSGWNFTIVAGVLSGLATRLRLGRGATLGLALSIMWIYALFTGASAAVLRAAAMASIAAVGRAAERQSEPWRLLLGGCWLISLADPHTLWDLGFQLSALATASLFAFARPVEGWMARRRPFCWPAMAPLTEALTATLAAQVLTLPLILYQFGNLSIVAPLANVLLVPVVPYAMLFGTLALVGGLAWLPLGQWLGPLAWLPLAWLSEGARVLAAPRWAAAQVPVFPLWVLLGFYAAVAALWWRGQAQRQQGSGPAGPA
ncbi:MAG: ComEC family competence protein, partial [Chloroflexales bacterium]|nr:ComEC family competence protein [Chloroflexales bacterium]